MASWESSGVKKKLGDEYCPQGWTTIYSSGTLATALMRGRVGKGKRENTTIQASPLKGHPYCHVKGKSTAKKKKKKKKEGINSHTTRIQREN